MRRRSGWCGTASTRGRAARALLGPGPLGRRHSGRPAASVRGYHARRAAGQAKTLARHRLRAVAVDGKTSRGARRADGTWCICSAIAGHGGHLLDHLEAGVKHNETSHFTEAKTLGCRRWVRLFQRSLISA